MRSSRGTLEMIDKLANSQKGVLLKQTINGEMIKKPDLWTINFINGSSIRAVPLGAGENNNNLRGFRCQVLIVDEALLVSPKVMELVLKPFLIGGSDVTEKQLIRQREDRLIAAGKMKEEDREVFKSVSKMIQLSSASYQWEPFYDAYKKYIKLIYDLDGQKDIDSDSTYFVQQYSYKVARKELMDPMIIKEIEEKLIPEHVIKREYCAQFISESGGYFDAVKMQKCTIPDGMLPCAEIKGDPFSEYILGIDPNVSSDAAADHFAMCLLKVVDKKDRSGNFLRKIGLNVHNYAYAGCSVSHHMSYLIDLLENFNISYIILDATQGDAADFISICNESEAFKNKGINLLGLDVNYNQDVTLIAKEIAKDYNKTACKIVQKQSFSSGSFLKASNEHLKTCLDFENIAFASSPLSVDGMMDNMSKLNIGSVYKTHPAFTMGDEEGTLYDFIQEQANLINLVKKECSLINPTMTSVGNISFDLPAGMKRSKDPRRTRKDSYSALLMANWGLKLYLMSQELPKEEQEEDLPPPMLC
jgi:hypothetical protein